MAPKFVRKPPTGSSPSADSPTPPPVTPRQAGTRRPRASAVTTSPAVSRAINFVADQTAAALSTPRCTESPVSRGPETDDTSAADETAAITELIAQNPTVFTLIDLEAARHLPAAAGSAITSVKANLRSRYNTAAECLLCDPVQVARRHRVFCRADNLRAHLEAHQLAPPATASVNLRAAVKATLAFWFASAAVPERSVRKFLTVLGAQPHTLTTNVDPSNETQIHCS